MDQTLLNDITTGTTIEGKATYASDLAMCIRLSMMTRNLLIVWHGILTLQKPYSWSMATNVLTIQVLIIIQIDEMMVGSSSSSSRLVVMVTST